MRRRSATELVVAALLALASPAAAQTRRRPAPVELAPGMPGHSQAVGSNRAERRRVLLPGRRPPERVTLALPQAEQPDPSRTLVPTAAPRGPIVLPGAPPADAASRSIVTVRGSSFEAMIGALRSVGEHRLAAELCRQAGGCAGRRSVRTLTAAVRRDALSIANDVLIDTPRSIYTARDRFAANEDASNERTKIPRLERVHGRADPLAQRAFDKAGVVLAFYRTVLGRRSFDDADGPLRLIVHYGVRYDNASWTGPRENDFGYVVALGDGDRLARPQTEGETVYHEVTHGVVERTADFEYAGESGALHEHFADVMAETCQQWERGESVEEAAWLFGEGTYAIDAPVGATRSLIDPGQYGHPAHVNEARRYGPDEDLGGVHQLNGIPNHAFYRAAIRLGGHSWEHVGLIWYAALRDLLGPHATIGDAAAATIRAAAELFGEHSREAHAVRAGWRDVGIAVGRRASRR